MSLPIEVISIQEWESVILGALFLPGLSPSAVIPPRSWPSVLHAVRVIGVPSHSKLQSHLRSIGHLDAATLLSEPDLVRQALILYRRRAYITAADPTYPQRWLVVLGSSTPPAMWQLGPSPIAQISASVVGSRSPSPEAFACAKDLLTRFADQGRTVISGGAKGIDKLVSQVSGNVALLPQGIHRYPRPTSTAWSLTSPDREFSATMAMARNALLYAAAPIAFVFGPRYREGGTWHGTIQALRRKLCHVCVFAKQPDLATDTLVALGASLFQSPNEAMALLQSHPLETGLFARQVHSNS